MKTPYYTIPFSFTEETLQWIKEKTAPIVENFQLNAPQPAALVELPNETLQEWYQSTMWQEILTQLAPIGLQTQPSIQLFIYKTLDEPKGDTRGNPHIDTFNGVAGFIPIRFNILLNGEENQEMVWWDIKNHMTDNRLHVVEFPRPNAPPGTMSKRIQARGNTMQERWDTVGEPEYSHNRLTKFNEYASFVRTDILHAIKWDGKSPRLILSVRFHEPWHMVERHMKD